MVRRTLLVIIALNRLCPASDPFPYLSFIEFLAVFLEIEAKCRIYRTLHMLPVIRIDPAKNMGSWAATTIRRDPPTDVLTLARHCHLDGVNPRAVYIVRRLHKLLLGHNDPEHKRIRDTW